MKTKKAEGWNASEASRVLRCGCCDVRAKGSVLSCACGQRGRCVQTSRCPMHCGCGQGGQLPEGFRVVCLEVEGDWLLQKVLRRAREQPFRLF